jgi:hypothetical protein
MRRSIVSLLGALLLVPLSLVSVASAQDATPAPESPFASLGLPELNITITAEGYEGIPESLAAGRYLVTMNVTDDTAGNGGGGVSFVQPSGMSGQDFVDFITELQSGGGAPPGAGGATPADGGGGDQGAPEFFYQSLIAGGSFAGPGQTVQVVLDLPPGDWVAWGDDPAAPQAPVVFTATGEMPTDLPEPESSATITMGEYVIKVTEGEITTGPQVLRVDNVGAQPHFVFSANAPEGISDADIEAILNADMSGATPPDLKYNPDTDFQDVFGTGTQSMGTSQWVYVPDMPAGPLVMLCFFPDQADSLPHALHGMYAIVEVGQ